MIQSETKKNVLVDYNPFEGDVIQKVVPATESQKEVFASCLLGARYANLAYNLSMSLHFEGALNSEVLKECAASLILRHESLRASFSEDGGKMIIYENQTIPFTEKNLQHLDPVLQQSEIVSAQLKDAETEFDIIHGPLIRFALFHLSADRHIFIITVHHLICDGWSLGILLEDLSKLYNAKLYGAALPPAASQFSDYAVKSILFEDTPAYQQIVAYWKQEYADNIPVFEIPPDFPRPPVRSYQGRRDDYILPAALADAVKKTGATYGSSFVNILMSAFEVLLYKYTGHDDIVIGLPTAGQAATEMFDLVGHCVNLLPLRSQPQADLSFADYLRQRKSKKLADYENQQFTFGTFLKELKMQRDLSRMPLAPVSLNIDMGIDLNVNFQGLQYRLEHNQRVAETYELFVNIADSDKGYVFQWSYNTNLYKASTMKGLMDKFVFVLTQIVSDPEQKIGHIRLEDEQQLMEYWSRWNNRDKTTFEGATLLELINKTCAAHPDKTAVLFKENAYSYQEIFEQSNQMAHYLIQQGVTRGMVVGVAMERSVELIIAILGIMKAGAVFVPLDPQYAQERIEYMLENSGAAFLLTTEAFKQKFKTTGREILVDQIIDQLGDFAVTLPEVAINSESLVYILYTSGSTGKPKGVMIANHSLVNYISWAVSYYLKGKPAVFPLYTSISFDLTITSIFSPLVSGSLLKTYHEEEPVTVLEKIFTDKEVNVVKLTPSHLKLVKDSPFIKKNLPGHYVTLIVGGEELETSVAREISTLFKGQVTICNEYGPTEATVGCMIYNYHVDDNLAAVPIGVPIANAHIYLLDEERRPVSKGVAGEIYIGGDCLAKGYYNKPDLTAERFLPDPFVPGGKMYKTGDNAIMLDNDVLLFKGRIDDQVKLRGYRIELGEIDFHISGLENVKNNITVVREDGAGNGYLVSYIVPLQNKENAEALKKEWRAALRNKLPDYMVPVAFVIIDELPLTTNGKVDKRKLPAPEMQSHGYVAPETPTELLLEKIWKEVFGKERIGVYDNFFELGGHSLLAVRVIRLLEHEVGLSIPLTSLFRFPVLRDFASELSKLQASQSDQEESQEWYLEASDTPVVSFPTTEPQVEIWQKCLIGGDEANISYNVAHAEYLSGTLDVALLKNAFQHLAERHELLRSIFSADGTTMTVQASIDLPFYEQDISGQDDEAQSQFISRFLKDAYETPFDLEKDLLFRVHIIKLSEQKHLLFFVIHHLICDGGSFDVIIKEVGEIYNSYLTGSVPVLGEAVKFSAYATKEVARYQGERYAQDVDYWVEKFKNDIPEPVSLASRYLPEPERTYKSEVFAYAFDESETATIEKTALRSNTTLTILLRTLFEVFIYRKTGQKDFVLGLPATDHLSVPGFSMVGHTINMLPIRAHVQNGFSFSDYMKLRNEEMLADFDHQKVTFGGVLRKLKFNRGAASNMVSVSFGSQLEKSDITLNLTGISHDLIDLKEEHSSFELYIDTYKRGPQIHFQVYYQTDLFSTDDVKALMASYHSVVNQVAAQPDIRISDVATTAEVSVFSKAIASEGPNILNQNIPALFARVVEAHPDQVAVRMEDDFITYEQLNSEANKLANYMRSQGVASGQKVAIILDRGIPIIVAIVAVLKCGATYVPVDPNYPQDRVSFLVEDAEAQFMITADRNEALAGKGINICLNTIKTELEKSSAADPDIQINPDTLAYILYTSGSTGKPKGAMVSHRNLIHFLKAMQDAFQVNSSDKFLSVSTISFDITCFDNYASLVNGAELVLTRADTVKDGQLLLDEVIKRNISLMIATPITFKLMLTADWTEQLPARLISAGEPLLPSLAKDLLPRCTALYNGYGPTETTVLCTLARVLSDEKITIGPALLDTPIYILNEKLEKVKDGETGELYIGGDGVAQGYWKRPELTEARFVKDPFAADPNAKMYKSGDLGRLQSNGEIKYEGRIDNQVKIRGFRIELGEIEFNVSRLRNVKDVVVKVLDDHTGEKSIVAYVIPQHDDGGGDHEFKKASILEWGNQLRAHLPYFMVPAYWVKMNSFPLTPNGKVDVKRIEPPKFYKQRMALASEDIVPEETLNPIEAEIKKIWEEELGIDGLHVEDNFFELGGHSMIAVKVMKRISARMNAKLPIATLFQHPTIAAIAKLVGSKAKVEEKILVEIKKSGSKPPIYLIHGGALNILLYKKLEPFLSEDQPLYGIQALGLSGDIKDLESIETIARRYLREILEVNSKGPYIIIGYSYGGIVAHEMVKQLMQLGKEVKMLGILDTNVGGRHIPVTAAGRLAVKLRRQVKKAAFIGGNLFKYPKEVIGYQLMLIKRKLFKETYKESEDEKIYDYDEKVIEAYNQAYYSYVMEPLDIKVHLFRVKERIYFLDDPVYLGWKRYTKGVVVHDVAGDHKTFLLPPHNETLVRIMEKAIRQT
ncbi:amino acid adenylation domain-containing protein [Niabella insulamsoli]|uniref:amino acid adenylation domain-containing protein n=1 Tax=Niabella insulamsoli TaxID=3144874 RepID=UPI0031FD563B